MNLTQEQQAKIFAQRIGQNVQTVQNVLPLRKMVRPSEQYTGPIVGVFKRRVSGDQWFVRVFIEGTHYEAAPDQFKLVVRSFRDLTDTEALQVAKMHYGEEHVNYHVDKQRQYIHYVRGSMHEMASSKGTGHFICEYLISIGMDMPVFIAPGHPDNFRTPTGLGMAIFQ